LDAATRRCFAFLRGCVAHFGCERAMWPRFGQKRRRVAAIQIFETLFTSNLPGENLSYISGTL
jgi:hypothetical protein